MTALEIARWSAAVLWVVVGGVLGLAALAALGLGVGGAAILLPLVVGTLVLAAGLSTGRAPWPKVSAACAIILTAAATWANLVTTPEAADGNLAVLAGSIGLVGFSLVAVVRSPAATR